MTASKPIDPLRAHLTDTIRELSERLEKLRDYAAVPENIWLARGELDSLNRLLAEIENQLDEIRAQDAENGY